MEGKGMEGPRLHNTHRQIGDNSFHGSQSVSNLKGVEPHLSVLIQNLEVRPTDLFPRHLNCFTSGFDNPN
jgi:hypothetical protein